MPYCQNCGAQVSEGTKYCSSCGSAIISDSPTRNNQGTLVFIRRPSACAKALKTKVVIDGLSYGELGENEKIELSLPFGTHTITLKCAGNPAMTESIQIGSTNTVFFPFKLSMSGKPMRIIESASYVGATNASTTTNQSNGKKAAIVVAILAIIAIFVLIASMGNDENDSGNSKTVVASNTSGTPASQRPTSTPRPTPAPTPFFTAYTDTVGNWEITVNDFSYKNSISVGLLREYRSEDGSKYCVINLTVKNVGKEAATFLPYISWGNEAVAKIKWNDYEYIRSELLFVNDTLSSETLNPLVSTTGDIVFELPDEIIESDTPPVLVITAGGKKFTCELKKTITP